MSWLNFAGANFAASIAWQRSHAVPTWPRCGSAWQVSHAIAGFFARGGTAGRPARAAWMSAGRVWHFTQATPAWRPA